MAQAVSQKKFLVRGFTSETVETKAGPWTKAVPQEKVVWAWTPEEATALSGLGLAKVAQ